MELTKINYVDEAERVVNTLQKDKFGIPILTTSRIRNILMTSATIYDSVKRKRGPLSEDEIADVQVLRIKLIYESGRNEPGVRDFLNKSNLIEKIKEIGDNREKLILYCKYIEALTAYHRYFGGKDN